MGQALPRIHSLHRATPPWAGRQEECYGKTSRAEKLRTSGGHAGGHAHRRRHRLAVACHRRDPPPAGANFHQSHVLCGGAAGVFLHRRSHRRDAERPSGRAHHGRHGADLRGDGHPRRRADVPVDEGISPGADPVAVAAHRGRRGLCRPGSAAGKFLHRRGFRGPAEPPGHAAPHRLFRAAGLRRQSRRRPRRPGGPWPDRRHAGNDAADPPTDLLCPGGLFRHLRRAGGGLWPQDRRGLRPGHGGVLPPVLRVPLHRLSPDGPAGRRTGRRWHHAAAYRPPGPDVSGDLLIGGHHPRQSGGGGGHRHQP